MSHETIILEKADGHAIIRFNRPESYNALNDTMALELVDALVDIEEDTTIRALLLTGNGKAFHAGGDVKQFAQAGDDAPKFIDRLVGPFHQAISHIIRSRVPTVSAINGVAAGAGFSMAMCCDMVLAHPDAVFTTAYSGIGASPDGGMTWLLVRLVGLRRALELYHTNRVLTAREAHDWGLVTRVMEPGQDLMSEATALARQLAQGPTLAFGKAKELFYHSLDNTLETQLEREARRIVASARTEDFKNGVRAFAEKQPPTFKGR